MRSIYRYMVLGLLLTASSQLAAVTTQQFQVNATITPGCVVTSGTGSSFGSLNFGTHSGVDNSLVTTSLVADASFSLACTPGVTLNMSIDGGQHYGSVRNLQLASSSSLVPYRLYSSNTFSAASEILVNQNVVVSYTNSNNITLPIYGAAQLTGNSPVGTYTDQLTVTLTY